MSTRAAFGILLPGDVLVHRFNLNDVVLVLRVGTRLDLLHLGDGRHLESWVAASSPIPAPYDVVRHGSLLSATG